MPRRSFLHLLLTLLHLGAACASDVARCVVDNRAHRQLPHQVCLATGPVCDALTRRGCAQACREAGFRLAGVEAGHQCCCGNRLANGSDVAQTSDCDTPCTGNASETCGGNLRLWVFDPHDVPPPPLPPAAPAADPRWIPGGRVLRSGGYSCQPYCSVLPDGTWSCVMTLIHAPIYIEGQAGEHMVAMTSRDQGRTWSPFVTIEPYSNSSTGQVSAYGSVTARPDGSRVFAIWIQNVNNVSHLPGHPASPATFRADMLGNFVWKYSDDQGKTWSDRHFTIPVPFGYIESINSFSKAQNGTGKTQIMWEVDHIKQLQDGTSLFAFTKIGTYAVAAPEEIFVLASKNLLSEEDPDKVVWDMWPHGDHGIAAVLHPDAPQVVTEEPHVCPILNDSVLTLFWRTSQGYMGHARSQTSDFAAAWKPSTFATYAPTWADDDKQYAAPNGSPVVPKASASWIKHPRGPLSPKKQPNGIWLMTYYNTQPLGAAFSHMKVSDRNNMWLTAGREDAGTGNILWSQPELVLYERQRDRGHGYPDIITDATGTYITETFKASPQSEAKTHVVSPAMLSGLFAQDTIKVVTKGRLAASFAGAHNRTVVRLPPQTLPNFTAYPYAQYGVTVDMWLDGDGRRNDSMPSIGSDSPRDLQEVSLFKTANRSFDVSWFPQNGTVRVGMQDARGVTAIWWTDPTCSRRMTTSGKHYVAVVVDGGPKMVMFMVDGKLCDGGPHPEWPNGHLLFNPLLGDVGSDAIQAEVGVNVVEGRVYSRALYTSELVGNWRAAK